MNLRENQNDFTMGHVAITVPDIDAAFVWHRDVLGCYVVANPSEANDDGSNLGNVVKGHLRREIRWSEARPFVDRGRCGYRTLPVH